MDTFVCPYVDTRYRQWDSAVESFAVRAIEGFWWTGVLTSLFTASYSRSGGSRKFAQTQPVSPRGWPLSGAYQPRKPHRCNLIVKNSATHVSVAYAMKGNSAGVIDFESIRVDAIKPNHLGVK